QPVLTLVNLRKSSAATEIIRGAGLALLPNERHAIIGPNGAGKSTLFHLISGNISPDSGEISLDGQNITGHAPESINRLGLSRSFQITNIFPRLSAYENIRMAIMRAHGLQYCFWKFISTNRQVRQQSEQLLERVRLSHRAAAIAGEMSYSEQRSLEIAM